MPNNPIELITIERNFPYSDPETAGMKDDWKTFTLAYGEIMIGSGREFFGAQKLNPELSGIIRTTQFIRGITTGMRIRHGFHGTFEITVVRDFPHGVYDKETKRWYYNELHLKKV
jgi:hypothetical protein